MIKNKFSVHSHPGHPKSYRELIDRDGDEQKSPRRYGSQDVGPIEIPTEWYLSREIHELEVERIWKKAWQVACLESDIPAAGDTWVYDIVGISLVLVRTERGDIRAFYNSCLHRGVTIRKCPGRVNSLQCPFHGFTWSLEGEVVQVPSLDQFPQVNEDNLRLPQVKVGTWEGFVFVNLDPYSESLEQFLGRFPEEFRNSSFHERKKVVHVRKIIPANWKAAQEAFMEGFHVVTTHPQQNVASSPQCHRHDAFENYSRGILPSAVASEYISRAPSEDEIFAQRMGRWDDDEPLPPLPAGQTARQVLARTARETVRRLLDEDLAERATTSDLIDTIYFTLYPNFHPFGSPLQPQVNIFRPHGDDHTRCEMDIIMFGVASPDDTSENPPVKIVKEDEDFSMVPELGFIGPFVNQDLANLGQIMKGLRNNQRGKIVLSREHELQIRHFYSLYIPLMGLVNEPLVEDERAAAE